MSRCCKSRRRPMQCCRPMCCMEPTYVEPTYVQPSYEMMPYGNYPVAGEYGGKGCCSFSCFIILILILLQFSCRDHRHDDCEREGRTIDKGIIFIIALFYLSCCSPCA
ncbi:hypothetical protein ACOAKC_04810 [Hathewaya histolytica]|uniref:hypothetical protein n=1 Tax=Hathewaya histolytica TaxID=1498 RepID=UPI003B6729D9